jgi:hypothetical protein
MTYDFRDLPLGFSAFWLSLSQMHRSQARIRFGQSGLELRFAFRRSRLGRLTPSPRNADATSAAIFLSFPPSPLASVGANRCDITGSKR